MKGFSFFTGAVVFAIGMAVTAMSASAADVYTINKDHSSIGFTVSHMMVSKVIGIFENYDGEIQFDAKDLANSKMDFVVKAVSINTRTEARDKHLRSADFFDADKYPDITFKTKKIEAKGGNDYIVTGDLTMKAVTKEVNIPVTVLGPVPDPMGKGQVLGIEAHFTLNRQDYGVNWNKALDNGGVMVGNDVAVTVLIEAHK